jgi:hypothetical protein
LAHGPDITGECAEKGLESGRGMTVTGTFQANGAQGVDQDSNRQPNQQWTTVT